MITNNQLIIWLNIAGVLIAYAMMGGSLWYAPVDFSTKGYWGMAILMLSVSLINAVKYRFEDHANQDRIRQLEDAKNEKILRDYVEEKV
ncbi:MAG: YiaA/YiaB family inner membrane protein [Pseudomonadota bacterium]